MKRLLLMTLCSAISMTLSISCGEDDGETTTEDPTVVLDVTPDTTQTIAAAGTVDVVITAPSDTQAYRITLVVADNVTVAGEAGTFIDMDMNDAADAGASEAIALITKVNGVDQAGAKTVPGGMDDPMSPSGVFAKDGKITLTITGVAAGTVYPVIYHNGGSSTFLEIDGSGKPVETYIIAGGITVQ